jgi:hypothetical protein
MVYDLLDRYLIYTFVKNLIYKNEKFHDQKSF